MIRSPSHPLWRCFSPPAGGFTPEPLLARLGSRLPIRRFRSTGQGSGRVGRHYSPQEEFGSWTRHPSACCGLPDLMYRLVDPHVCRGGGLEVKPCSGRGSRPGNKDREPSTSPTLTGAVENAGKGGATPEAAAPLVQVIAPYVVPVSNDDCSAADRAVRRAALCIVHVAGVDEAEPVGDRDLSCPAER